ncbi:uncharacterized protein LOC124837081 [Vigna umbellata]|uniref:uncharacterized protein LOC124837081 n=1 Tax=Vigna umbellata TaxID=87088 RepID=UPI001F5E8EBF|nr:uncharacterized protein LOC124837081 [Vigna umbellata]
MFYDCVSRIVGLDIGQSNTLYPWGEFTLYLCDEFTCIIIPLLQLNSIPESLMNFLCLPDHTFVGVGIEGKMGLLETQFGIRCRNVVELGPWAADVLGMPHLGTCGIDKLALEVVGFDLGRWRRRSRLYEDSYGDLLLPTVNVCCCYQIGRKLFEKPAISSKIRRKLLEKPAISSKIERELLAERVAISSKRGRVIRRKNWLVWFGFCKSRFAVFVMIFLVFVGCIMNFDGFRKSKL